MECREARSLLTGGAVDGGTPAGVEKHLEACPACVRYATRMRATRSYFKRRADVEPHPAFAARVVQQLGRERSDVLGQAALRLMPVAFAMLLVLAWLSIRVPGDAALPADLAVGSQTSGDEIDDDLLSWLLEGNGNGR